MKLIFLIVVFYFSVSAFAYERTAIHGLNEAGEEIQAHVEGRYDDTRYAWSITVGVDGDKERVFKNQPCGYSGQYENTFSCASEGNSPLAGTSYDFRKELDNCEGLLFICKSGCNQRAPIELIIKNSEDSRGCQKSEQEEMEALEMQLECNKKDRQGATVTIIADKVNLMDTPSGKVLRTLNIGTKAKLILGDGICTTISGITGQWIKVKFIDKKTAQDGWIFDADVEYHNNP